MKKTTLIIAAHPSMEQSVVNKALAERVEKETTATVHYLYEAYPDGKINVEKEQALLLSHDRIVFQFPFYWYSTPALLKEWQDTVLTYGWAYGSGGDKLHGKEFLAALSTGGPKEAYNREGYNYFEMEELLKPLHAMANLTGMKYMAPFMVQGVRMLTEDQLKDAAEEYVSYAVKSL
ncbi:NAD(P)H-dependent oxidoreductase [Metabacillus sp. FJAT-52054]|uniref:NAD(P)H-dependent oxidoreductase n=1 Tax=Metabacillus sediminis TaxID=3117746 RepID=A0ABZ2NEN2_9BACI